MVRGQQIWWREMTYQRGGGQDGAVLLKHFPPGFFGLPELCWCSLCEAFGDGEGGNVARLSACSVSLCEWLFRGALTCAGAWGKCQCEPSSVQPRTCRSILDATGSTLALWVLLRSWCLLFGVTWSWESAPTLLFSLIRDSFQVKK